MHHTHLLPLVLSFALGVSCAELNTFERRTINPAYLKVCKQIERQLKQGDVAYPLELGYAAGIEHYMLSSTESSACVVTPANAQEVGTILKIVGMTRTPFAVKSGGHASNKGFSSTKGVHISLEGFKTNVFNADKSEITFGTGQIWDEVYAFTEGTGRNVVGGRVSGVDSCRHGLTIDTAQAFELVLPNGTIKQVTEQSSPDLFFALRGAGNNFGIVTKITLRTVPQVPKIWGGFVIYAAGSNPAISQATQEFAVRNEDPKAVILPTISTFLGFPTTVALFFYNGETPPAGTFDMFNGIPAIQDARKTQGFLEFVKSTPDAPPSRGTFHTVPILNYSQPVMDAILNQTNFYAKTALLNSGTFVANAVEPFDAHFYDHSKGGAYPHSSTLPVSPFNMYLQWVDPLQDNYWRNEIKKSCEIIRQAAIADGQNIQDAVLYPNYALSDTPLVKLFGPQNLARLKNIKRAVDPFDVMSLAGGFKL